MQVSLVSSLLIFPEDAVFGATSLTRSPTEPGEILNVIVTLACAEANLRKHPSILHFLCVITGCRCVSPPSWSRPLSHVEMHPEVGGRGQAQVAQCFGIYDLSAVGDVLSSHASSSMLSRLHLPTVPLGSMHTTAERPMGIVQNVSLTDFQNFYHSSKVDPAIGASAVTTMMF